MGYSFDASRNKYIVRETISGKRKYIGQYDSEKIASLVDLANKPSVLSEQKINFVEDDVSFQWLAAFRKWNTLRKQTRLAKKILNIK